MDIKNFNSAIAQIAEEKGISVEKVLESIEAAIASAYKKDYGKKGQIIRAKLDPKSGMVRFWQVKQVLDESMVYTDKEIEQLKEKKSEGSSEETNKVRFNPDRHIMIAEAKKINPGVKPGEEIKIPLESHKDYGRIAAQTAKQVIIQKLREAERESIFEEYKSKEGEIVSGVVQRIEGKNVYLDIGKTLGILTKEEQVPGEFYRPGQRLKVYILRVEETPKGPIIFLSRAYPKLVSKLFELEVPEISSGQVQIRSIAREAGSRTKISVSSASPEIDPIGATVGQRGTRVQAVINELGGEKIDIIEYSDEPEKYISNALAPAKVLEVKIMPKNTALAIIPNDQLSLAIGRDGQNVRLAAKLTGWKIDVRSSEAIEKEGGEPTDSESVASSDEEKDLNKEKQVKEKDISEDNGKKESKDDDKNKKENENKKENDS